MMGVLKGNGGGSYWKELLDRIRDIRSSEKFFIDRFLIYMQQVSIIIRRHRNQSGFLRLFKINCILQLTDIQLQKLYMSVLMQKNRLWD